MTLRFTSSSLLREVLVGFELSVCSISFVFKIVSAFRNCLCVQKLNFYRTFDIDDNTDLSFGLGFGGDAVDAHFEDVVVAHLQKFTDFAVSSAWDIAELVFAKVDGNCVGVELVFVFQNQRELFSNFELVQNDAAVPIGEAGYGKCVVVSSDLFHTLHKF